MDIMELLRTGTVAVAAIIVLVTIFRAIFPRALSVSNETDTGEPKGAKPQPKESSATSPPPSRSKKPAKSQQPQPAVIKEEKDAREPLKANGTVHLRKSSATVPLPAPVIAENGDPQLPRSASTRATPPPPVGKTPPPSAAVAGAAAASEKDMNKKNGRPAELGPAARKNTPSPVAGATAASPATNGTPKSKKSAAADNGALPVAATSSSDGFLPAEALNSSTGAIITGSREGSRIEPKIIVVEAPDDDDSDPDGALNVSKEAVLSPRTCAPIAASAPSSLSLGALAGIAAPTAQRASGSRPSSRPGTPPVPVLSGGGGESGGGAPGWTLVQGKKGKERALERSQEALPIAQIGNGQRIAPEDDEGHIEYKLKLINIGDERLQHLVSQMLFRLSEGQGKAIYRLGVTDDGEQVGVPKEELDASIQVVRKMAEQLSADVHMLARRPGATGGEMAELLIEKRVREDGVFDEVRVAVVGNVDSGKSTLLGVLSKGVLDNGRGLARLNIFKHKHEVETGRTSDIAKEILGFDQAARPVNYSSIRPPTWPEICESSSKVIMFIDLAGHEKYLKTTVFGLTGNFPDYTMMVVGANMGVVGMTREHYQLTLAMKVPVYMVITKIDMCPANVLENTLDVLQKMLKAPGSMKLPMIVKTREDATTAARNFLSDRLVPIFLISSVTGESLDLLRHFLFMLPPTRDWNALLQQPAEFFLDNTYSVAGVGTVVSGTLMSGVVKLNQTLLLGPDPFGNFIPVQIKGIHTNRLPVKFARAGQSASFALKKTKRKEIRRGMVLADPAAKPQSCWEFDAEILIITHSTTITRSYEAVIHCGCTRQTAKIMGMGEGDVLRSGHRAIVRFRYKQFPEFLKVGERLIFREGKTKGIGRIAKLYPVDGKAPH